MMTREEWEMAHQIEKLEGGSILPVYAEPFLVDIQKDLAPQFLDAVRHDWPSISNGTYAVIRVNNPLERN
jgi:hypothetical protein